MEQESLVCVTGTWVCANDAWFPNFYFSGAVLQPRVILQPDIERRCTKYVVNLKDKGTIIAGHPVKVRG